MGRVAGGVWGGSVRADVEGGDVVALGAGSGELMVTGEGLSLSGSLSAVNRVADSVIAAADPDSCLGCRSLRLRRLRLSSVGSAKLESERYTWTN